jgi:hypothetical protein
MITAQKASELFQNSIMQWHLEERPTKNLFDENSIKFVLFKKNQIDTIQWHKEDEIRRTDLDPGTFMLLKREIDLLNQQRTDVVEKMDDLFLEFYKGFMIQSEAKLNSESPAWLLDRMSILELKIFHMEEQSKRIDISLVQKNLNEQKFLTLKEQRSDLINCFTELIQDRILGNKYFKVYRQMKMYNDPELNPSLYRKK